MLTLTLALVTLLSGGDDLANDLATGLDALVAEWDRGDSPGGAIAVVRDGEPTVVRTFGMADLAQERPVAAETPFYIASLAKPFTAACVLRAAEAGELDLDASLRDVFPELPEAYAAATLRDCIGHRSGVLDVYDAAIGLDLGAEVLSSNAAAIELLGRLPWLCFTPGEQFLYSNSGYVLLAEALERATGKALVDHAREHVFEARGMRHAAYLGEPRLEGEARAYGRGSVGWGPREVATGLHGPGGLYLSLADLIAFAESWPGDGPHTPEGGEHNPDLGPYVDGWMLQHLGGQRAVRHPGGAFGFSSDFIRFPALGVTVIALSNCAELGATDLAEATAELALGERYDSATGPSTVELTREQAGAFAGLWRDARNEQLWFVLPRGERFKIAALGDLEFEVAPVSATRLEPVAPQAAFSLEVTDAGLELERGGLRIPLERLPLTLGQSTPLEEFLGEYESATVGARITLVERDGKLALHQEWDVLPLPVFHFVSPDTFLCERGALLRFHRDDAGAVTDVVMDVNRARGIELTRVR